MSREIKQWQRFLMDVSPGAKGVNLSYTQNWIIQKDLMVLRSQPITSCWKSIPIATAAVMRLYAKTKRIEKKSNRH